ncbi:unnamed protein product [Discosporangium mesarthrocarpum]
MLCRTNIYNKAGDLVPSPRPDLVLQYKDVVVHSILKAQEATGEPLVQLTPVSLEVKKLIEVGVMV